MRAVNLLPRDLERQRGDGGKAPVFVAAGGVVAVTTAAVLLFVSASGSISDQQSRLDSLEAEIAQVPNRTGQPAVAPDAIAQERSDRVAALSAALTTQVPLDRLLRSLAYVLPEDAWLTGLTATTSTDSVASTPSGTPATPTTTQGVTIHGATYSNQSVARVLARLSAIPSLGDVRLSATERVEPAAPQSGGTPAPKTAKAKQKKQRTVVRFTIDASISGSGS